MSDEYAKEKLLLDIVERLCTLDMELLIKVFGHRVGENFYSLKCKYSPRDIVYFLTYNPKTNEEENVITLADSASFLYLHSRRMFQHLAEVSDDTPVYISVDVENGYRLTSNMGCIRGLWKAVSEVL